MTPITVAEALDVLRCGISIVPVRENKTPASEWLLWQRQLPTPGKVRAWFGDGHFSGIAYITGPVSDGLICLEFDDAGTWTVFRDTAEAVGLGDLLDRIVAGFCDQTPGGGIHLLFRCDECGRNTALARRPKRPGEMRDEHDKIKVLVETREGGGCVISAPSNGRVHPSGRPYVRLSGGPETITSITPQERADLYGLARAFCQMPRPQPRERIGTLPSDGTRPGDDFGRRTAWAELLEPAGWTRAYQRGDEEFWRRPGKSEGVSATVNYKGSDLLYVFTSSTEFEPETSYSRFGFYATIEHGGDFAAAARDLHARGFGARTRRPFANVGGFGRPREGTVRIA